ncbi:MAG: cell envelope integrity protein CreD [Treponema sp.]|nr:cell envelope integrity protein CreD [Treponema sp.]
METKETAAAVETKLIKEPVKTKRFGGIGVKLIFIAIVIIGLLIGLGFVKGQLDDRESAYTHAKWEISSSAGGSMYFEGPYILVPYKKSWNENVYKYNEQYKELKTEEGWVQLPADYVNIDSSLDSEIRPIGIYSSPIFTGNASILATFNVNMEKVKQENNVTTEYIFDKAMIFVSIKNSSLRNAPLFNINEKDYSTDFIVIDELQGIGSEFELTNGKIQFSANIGLRGAESFNYRISAKETKLTLASDWTAPGFTGFSYLPDKRKITDEGFSAEWNVNFGSNEITQYIGTSFIEPVNLYQKLYRAIKYGFLFIIVPFIILFLIEVFAKITLHPVNYLLCGAACVLFFLMLLSLSEHIPFDASYIFAALLAGITVSLYVASITKKFKLGLVMMIMFVMLYSYLFFSLKSEDYALLIGSFFAFAILASLMFFTRKVNWYNLKSLAPRK